MHVVVVGAGAGGLAAAIELAHAGHRVDVLEQSDAPGGKCARITRGQHTWDAGPSLLTLPGVFADLFDSTGAPLADELELVRVEPVTRYAFADGSSVALSADLPVALEALEAWSPGSGTDWARFLGTCAGMWQAAQANLTGPPLWPPRRPGPGEAMPDPRDGLRVRPWATLRDLARRHTADRRLQMIIERFATYAGGDPRRTPAALAVAGYVEHAFGAWHPRGGLHELIAAMARRLAALGGALHTATPVRRIVVRGGRAVGVETDHGLLSADAVITDVDERAVREQLLGLAAPTRPSESSVSGLAVLLGLRGRGEHRDHHLIRFPADPHEEFDDVFVHRRPARDPTVYVCVPGVSDPSAEPAGAESWFVLVNAPAIGAEADWEAEADRVIARLGVGPRLTERVVRGPAELERETGAVGGAIYGRAPHGRLRGLLRPGHTVPGVQRLWLAGGTVHPGGGLPLAVLGGRTVARAAARGLDDV
jgi:phytoene desaturase